MQYLRHMDQPVSEEKLVIMVEKHDLLHNSPQVCLCARECTFQNCVAAVEFCRF